jgi:hypothetical protein
MNDRTVLLNFCFTLTISMHWINIYNKKLEASLVGNNGNSLKVNADKTKFMP